MNGDDSVAPPLAAERVSVLQLVVRLTLGPAASATASCNPLRLLTTWPAAMPVPVTAPLATVLAVVAVVAVEAVVALAAMPALGA